MNHIAISIIANIAMALLIFIINSVLGKIQYGNPSLFHYGKLAFACNEEDFSGNFYQKIINPTILMSIFGACMQHFGYEWLCRSLWMLVPIYWFLRVIYVLLKNTIIFLNISYEIVAAFASLLLGETVFFAVILPLINKGETILIPIDEFRNAIWFAIIAYIGKVFWDIYKNTLTSKAVVPLEKREIFINRRYDVFSKKYGEQIMQLTDALYPSEKENKGNFICLVYAIMIFEDYNRPKSARFIENLIKKVNCRNEMTLGIMQVKTRKLISDNESIELAIKKISSKYLQYLNNEPIEHALADYNNDANYQNEVMAIYDVLLELLSIDRLINDNEAYII